MQIKIIVHYFTASGFSYDVSGSPKLAQNVSDGEIDAEGDKKSDVDDPF